MITKKDRLENVDFREGASLLIDKPLTWTSFDVVNKIRFTLRFLYRIKKIKVGHAGTLDPLASGLLIICTGKHTKKLMDFQGMDKTYTGTMVLGKTTPTYDAESNVDQEFPTDHIDQERIEQVRQNFLGEIDQVPPIFSAVKKNGQKAYELARRGKEIELEARKVSIHNFELGTIQDDKIQFEVTCSKGTYIRSLVHDLGKALNSGAYLCELKRTQIGHYKNEDAFDLFEFNNAVDQLTKDKNT